MCEQVRERQIIFITTVLKLLRVPRLTSPSSSSTSRKSKSLKTLNCCSEVVSSILSGSRVPSSEDTRLGWCSMRSSSPQLENITYREKHIEFKNTTQAIFEHMAMKFDVSKQLYYNRRCILPKDFLWAPLLVHTETKHSPVFLAFFSVKKMETFNTKTRKPISQDNTVRRMGLWWCRHFVKCILEEIAWVTQCILDQRT